MKKFFLLLTFLILTPFFSLAQQDNVNIDLTVFGCNNNGVCEVSSGEDINTCSLDCSPSGTSTPVTPSSSTSSSNRGSSGGRINNPTPAVANATEVVAYLVRGNIALEWNNPDGDNFSYVRIMKSEEGFATSPQNGILMYEGSGESFYDGVVEDGKVYYYTLFVRASSGAYSSGVSTKLLFKKYPVSALESPFGSNIFPYGPITIFEGLTMRSLESFLFEQEGRFLNTDGNVVILDPNLSTKVSFGLTSSSSPRTTAFLHLHLPFGTESYMFSSVSSSTLEAYIPSIRSSFSIPFSIIVEDGGHEMRYEGVFNLRSGEGIMTDQPAPQLNKLTLEILLILILLILALFVRKLFFWLSPSKR
jgi:hypothetical protein